MRHGAYVLQYFPIIFKKEPHHGELVHEFRFILYVCHVIELLFESVCVCYLYVYILLFPLLSSSHLHMWQLYVRSSTT
jgi:hypothetical protein